MRSVSCPDITACDTNPHLPRAVNTSLFTPCLLFNKVAFSLTPDKLAELYIIPIGFCFVSAFSAGVAYLLGRVAGLRKGQRDFASAFSSSTLFVFSLVPAIAPETRC